VNTPSGKVPTTTPTETPLPLSSRTAARKAVWAALVGSSLEAFDFYVFAYFSAIFAPALFFPELDPAAALLGSFAVIAVAFIVRPIGAVIFGNLGDRIGRKRTLIITITIMGLATGAIGLLPDFATIGLAAPILLVLLRVVQGLSLGGEWGGGILVAVEHADPKRRGFYAALPQLGSPVGTTLTAALLLIMSATLAPEAMLAWGWRVPFLLAFPLLAVSLYLRFTIDETPVFKEIVADDKRERLPVLAVFRKYPVAVIVAIGAALLGIGSYSLMNTYTIGYGISVLGFSYPDLALATLIGSLLQFVTIPLFGVLANRIGSAKVVAIGAAGTLLIAFPMYLLLTQATFGVLVATMIIGGILPTLSWAALGGLMSDLFDDDFRYSALSVAYSVAALISGFVPSVTLALGAATGNAWWHPALVLGIMSAITLVGAIAAARMSPPIPAGTEAIEAEVGAEELAAAR
jgi:MFS family permease